MGYLIAGIHSVDRALQDVPYSEETLATAKRYTELAWYDIAAAFKEVAYDVSENEKERILHIIFKKKVSYLHRRS